MREINKLYRDMIYQYFLSKQYTEKQAKLISESEIPAIDKMIELEKIKDINGIMNLLQIISRKYKN